MWSYILSSDILSQKITFKCGAKKVIKVTCLVTIVYITNNNALLLKKSQVDEKLIISYSQLFLLKETTHQKPILRVLPLFNTRAPFQYQLISTSGFPVTRHGTCAVWFTKNSWYVLVEPKFGFSNKKRGWNSNYTELLY